MSLYKKLFAFKVPGTWAIIRNFFGDEDLVVKDGIIINDEFYKEDLLLIKPLFFNGESWVIDKEGVFLDLGWYPDSDPSGCYRLTLLKGDWDNIVLVFESVQRNEIRSVIERCLDLITQGISDEDIQQWINVEYSRSSSKN